MVLSGLFYEAEQCYDVVRMCDANETCLLPMKYSVRTCMHSIMTCPAHPAATRLTTALYTSYAYADRLLRLDTNVTWCDIV